MSEYSELCRLYLKKNNINVHRLSQISGLDRTMMQKMVKGQRIPSEEYFNTFISYLGLNPMEKEKITVSYHKERIGRDAFTIGLAIDDIINNYQTYNEELLDTPLDQRDIEIKERISEYNNKSQIRLIAQKVVRDELERKYPTISFSLDDTSKQIRQIILSNNNKVIDIDELILFKKDRVLENLGLLKYVLPFIFECKDNYNLYVRVADGMPQDHMYLIYKYFIVTSQDVFLISADQKRALLIHDPDYVSIYKKAIDRLKSEYLRVKKAVDDPIEYVRLFKSIDDYYKLSALYTLHPFYTDYFKESDKFSNSVADFPLPSDRYEMTHHSRYKNFIHIYNTVGVERFVNEGILPTIKQPGHIYTLEERKNIIKEIIKIHKKRRNAYMTKAIVKRGENSPEIRLYRPNILVITLFKKYHYGILIIRNDRLYDILHKFVKGCINEKFIYNVNESIVEWCKMLSIIEQRLDNE